MRIRFWGVRGSTPTPQPENLRYGGNTPCVEVRSDAGALLIVDCGTGLRMLGKTLMSEFGGRPIRAHILISHFHWDHIQGLPFFTPLYHPANWFHLHSFHPHEGSLELALGGQMTNPYFPVNMTAMRAQRQYSELGREMSEFDDFRVRAGKINHPQGCLAFRIENNGKTVVYATDNEPGDSESDKTVRELCRGADVLIYDAQYAHAALDREKRGWGHSSWEDGVRVAKASGVKRLILFHHDPDNDDRAIDRLQEDCRVQFPHSSAAYEVMDIKV